ncbi:MAG: chemotaxis protein CheC [Deltaproteobacteria bacterium]|nr:chemotaxis protein CheC [Deltaproteobacteria bacterium]
MIETPEDILSIEEQDILQEIMNIGFGSAAADLASVINLHVILSVPTINIIESVRLLDYIKAEIRDYPDVSVIEQNFYSKFKGVALLVFSGASGKTLLSLIAEDEAGSLVKSDPIQILEKETLMELGNILVGACVGKVADLLGDIVSYSPPRIITGNMTDGDISEDMIDPKNIVIIMQAVFHFENKNVEGYLFLVTSHESIDWLKQATRNFLQQYE